MQVVFGKAFLAELERGNIERATLFARAFVLRTASLRGHRSVNVAANGVVARSSRRPAR